LAFVGCAVAVAGIGQVRVEAVFGVTSDPAAGAIVPCCRCRRRRHIRNDRMTHMSAGFAPPVDQLTAHGHAGFLYSVAYVSFQELATRISHRTPTRPSKRST
jgi:hypothetical protein